MGDGGNQVRPGKQRSTKCTLRKPGQAKRTRNYHTPSAFFVEASPLMESQHPGPRRTHTHTRGKPDQVKPGDQAEPGDQADPTRQTRPGKPDQANPTRQNHTRQTRRQTAHTRQTRRSPAGVSEVAHVRV